MHFYSCSSPCEPISRSQGGEKNSEEDINLAVSLFRALRVRDPQNGIYPFMLGAILDKNNRPREDIENAFRSFLQSTKFQNPIIPLVIELFELGFLNATAFIHATELIVSTNGPDYTPALQSARALARDPIFANYLPDWSKKFSLWLEQAEKSNLPAPYIWSIELNHLRIFTKTMWESQIPNEEVPSHLSNDYFRETNEKFNNPNFERILESAIEGEAECMAMSASIKENFDKIIMTEQENIQKWRKLAQ